MKDCKVISVTFTQEEFFAHEAMSEKYKETCKKLEELEILTKSEISSLETPDNDIE